MDNKYNKPELRFPGFSDEWEHYNAGDLYIEKKESGNEDLPILSVSIHSGVSDDELDEESLGKTVRRSKDKSSYKRVSEGDLVFNMMRAWQGAIGVAKCDGMVSPAYITATPNDMVYPLFMDYALQRKKIVDQINDLSYGVTDFRKRLYWNSFVKVQCSLPSIEEQKKISMFFDHFEKLIDVFQRRYTILQGLKKGLLQKMFPRPGENIPEIRFPGFSDPWEQRKVSDVANRYDNLRIPVAASERVSGSTPYYGANGIQDYVDGYTHDGEFVLIAEDGANDLTNYPVQYTTGKIWVNNHAHVLQGKEEITDNKFLGYSIKSINIEPLLVGGGRTKLNAEVMMGIELLMPSYQEQCNISTLLFNFDNLITLHQRKLEQFKAYKRGLAQKLFV